MSLSRIGTLCAVVLTVSLASPVSVSAQNPAAAPTAESVTVPSGSLMLRGVLVRPAGPGPFPVFVYNHGSVAAERASEPLRTQHTEGGLTDVLSRKGYLVLRLARRGYFGSAGTASTYDFRRSHATEEDLRAFSQRAFLGLEEETSDVLAGIEFAVAQPGADRDRVAVGGFGSGGLVSVAAAGRDPRIKTVVSMVGGFRVFFTSRTGSVSELSAPAVENVWKRAAKATAARTFILWVENSSLSPEMGRELERVLRQNGKVVEMKVYPKFGDNGSQMFNVREGFPLYVPDVVRFLDAGL